MWLRLPLGVSLTVGCLVVPLSALAGPPVIPEPSDMEAFARLAFEAVTQRNWALVAALAVIAIVYVLRRFGGTRFPFLRTDRGGALLVLLVALAGAVGNVLLAGTPFTVAVLVHVLVVALSAAGGFNLLKKLLFGDAVVEAQQIATTTGQAAAATVSPRDPIHFINGN